MSVLRQAARVAWKDLRIELRSREIVYTMAFFGGLIVVVYSMAFPVRPDLVRAAVPGMLWVAIAFAGTIGLGRAFDRERENDTMRALLLAPIPRLSVFLGKARIVSYSRSRSNARPRPIVPANAIATHSIPGTAARTRSGRTGNAIE